MFQEVLLKPLWIQFILKHPEFEKDKVLKSSIGLVFNEENLFKLMKERDLAEKGSNTISNLMAIKEPTINPDGTPGEASYFDAAFLVQKFMSFTDEDMKQNEKFKKQRADEIKKLAKAYARMNAANGAAAGGGEPGGDMGGGGFDLGGGGGDFGGGLDLGGGGEAGAETGAEPGGEADSELGI